MISKERSSLHDRLVGMLNQGCPSVQSICIIGPSGCGKSHMVEESLLEVEQSMTSAHIQICCFELSSCKSSARYLYELILATIGSRFLKQFDISSLIVDSNAAFVESLCELLLLINEQNPSLNCIGIVFDESQLLLGLSPDIIATVVNIGSLISYHCHNVLRTNRVPKVFSLLISCIPWDKYFCGTFYAEPVVFNVPAYTKEETTSILISQKPVGVDLACYTRFVGHFITVCLPVTRNIGELLYLSKKAWVDFNQVLQSGAIAGDDSWGEWKAIQPILKKSLNMVFLRTSAKNEPSQTSGSDINLMELPYLTRFLLIAAFMASYNPGWADRKFLVKNTGKMNKRAKRQEKAAERTENHLFGPKSFNLDRMMAIFRALTAEESVTLTTLVAAQVKTLISLGLIVSVSGALGCDSGRSVNPAEDALANPKLSCAISLDAAKALAKTVNFDLTAHLTDYA